MKLFLVRHGEAKSKSEDPDRSLTQKGIRNAEKIARWMSRINEEVTEIQHSGKRRAEQTAAIFTSHLSPPRGVVSVSGLKPNDDVRPIADMLSGRQESLMIVGHLPFLNRLASLLVTGNPDDTLVRFRDAAVICLIEEEGLWSIAWFAIPDLIDASGN